MIARALLLLVLLIPGVVEARDDTSLLSAAHEQYREALNTEDRDQRIAKFHAVRLQLLRLAETHDNAELQTDIGNAALQAEDLGSAVLAYRRALHLDPDHERALMNLAHARSLMPSWVPLAASGSALDSFFFWHRTLSTEERASGAALAFFVFGCLIAAWVRWRKPGLRLLAMVPCLVWVFLLASMMLAPDDSTMSAVVTNPGGEPALSADAPGARPVFSNPLPAGTEVRVLEERAGWTHIELADGSRTAWVRSGSLQTVAPGVVE